MTDKLEQLLAAWSKAEAGDFSELPPPQVVRKVLEALWEDLQFATTRCCGAVDSYGMRACAVCPLDAYNATSAALEEM